MLHHALAVVFPTRVGMDRLCQCLNLRDRCFSHPRGDGPSRHFWNKSMKPFSPPAWGWTAVEFQEIDFARVFPTRVGMDRLPGRRRPLAGGFPHPRGDGPLARIDWLLDLEFSPPAWGWTVWDEYYEGSGVVFPTRVGMDRCISPPTTTAIRFPHPRGDGPQGGGLCSCGDEFSPPAWGWTVYIVSRNMPFLVFPTRVGMDRVGSLEPSKPGGFPHPRGDGPPLIGCFSSEGKFSPPAWGWTDEPASVYRWLEVFPTRVGMDRRGRRLSHGHVSFPHPRGDGPPQSAPHKPAELFSPPAWGWTGRRIGRAGFQGVFPTRVGMDRDETIDSYREVSFPHPRGDGPPYADLLDAIASFSPPAWGWTGIRPWHRHRGNVFPTRVGMDRCRLTRSPI